MVQPLDVFYCKHPAKGLDRTFDLWGQGEFDGQQDVEFIARFLIGDANRERAFGLATGGHPVEHSLAFRDFSAETVVEAIGCHGLGPGLLFSFAIRSISYVYIRGGVYQMGGLGASVLAEIGELKWPMIF